jgi:gliding motility-associated-like protein
MMNSRKVYFNKSSLCFTKKVTLKKKSFEILNVFSPNGDGINDVWTLKGLKDFPNCTVEIFTRYGQKIFFSKGYNKPWDGVFNGTGMPVGTYYYVIDLRDGTKPFGGSVTVLR